MTKTNRYQRPILSILLLGGILLVLYSCGTLEIRIEKTPTPVETTAGSMESQGPKEATSVPTRELAFTITSVSPEVTPWPTFTPEATAPPTPMPEPTGAPLPTAEPASPRIVFFEITPIEADPGETITLTWQASGNQATICPSSRFILYGYDCRQVPLSGMITFTIPLTVYYYVEFRLEVQDRGSSEPETQYETVWIKCRTTWFFSDKPQANICPHEPLISPAAAQYFERGIMIWIESLGRYIILEETLLYEGDVRKSFIRIDDPLELTRDTSSEVSPPEGFYAPISGFGFIWRGDTGDPLNYRELLGWALAPEFGYEAIFQCDNAMPSGGQSWRFCCLRGPKDEVIVFHPLGGWYLLGERGDTWP